MRIAFLLTIFLVADVSAGEPARACEACAFEAAFGGAAASNPTAFREWKARHRREPYGWPTPIGCSNAMTEFKFVFGSCRQFFGNGESTELHGKRTFVP